jgi:hypothetical protein
MCTGPPEHRWHKRQRNMDTGRLLKECKHSKINIHTFSAALPPRNTAIAVVMVSPVVGNSLWCTDAIAPGCRRLGAPTRFAVGICGARRSVGEPPRMYKCTCTAQAYVGLAELVLRGEGRIDCVGD